MLKERIQEDAMRALKSGDSSLVGTLRLLLAALQSCEIEKRGTGQSPTLTDEDVVMVLQREAKKRKEAAALFTRGGRDDLARHEAEELAIVERYLPEQIGAEEIKKTLEELKAAGHADFASLMREGMKKLRGKADGNTVSAIAKEILNG